MTLSIETRCLRIIDAWRMGNGLAPVKVRDGLYLVDQEETEHHTRMTYDQLIWHAWQVLEMLETVAYWNSDPECDEGRDNTPEERRSYRAEGKKWERYRKAMEPEVQRFCRMPIFRIYANDIDTGAEITAPTAAEAVTAYNLTLDNPGYQVITVDIVAGEGYLTATA